MRLGIDLGTTRTLVAVGDRGNYPVVGFETPDGDIVEHVPSVSAEVGGRLVHGHEAERAARDGAPSLRSFKRLLGQHGPDHRVTLGRCEPTLLELTTDFLRALATQLRSASNLPGALAGGLPEVVVSVPANAHSSQRFVTLEAFRAAGFSVRAMINEPSAAAIEYAHRYRGSLNSRRDHVVVYDLGGGTFDAALVMVADDHHDVVDTAGIQQLGGDDFDEVLLDLALEMLDIEVHEADLRGALLHECCAAKESIGANTRRVALELGALGSQAPSEPLVVAVSDYYERLRPLVERSLDALGQVMAPQGGDGEVDDLKSQAAQAGIAGVYVVGGGSGLPLVPRLLREHFGRRVQRSTYPAAAIAIGLAIAADTGESSSLSERLTRHLGVFRESDRGARVTFDRIFARGTPMPPSGGPPLVAVRAYRAAHNVGHFRFVECADLDGAQQPRGDISPHGSVTFPFQRPLRGSALDDVNIERLSSEGPAIEERYEVDASGVVAVTIRDVDDGFEQRFVLG